MTIPVPEDLSLIACEVCGNRNPAKFSNLGEMWHCLSCGNYVPRYRRMRRRFSSGKSKEDFRKAK